MKLAQTVQDLFRGSYQDYIDTLRAEARKQLRLKPSITIEDLTEVHPRPDFVKPNTMGKVFLHPDFEPTGAPVRAKHQSAKGHWLGRWKLSREYKRLHRSAERFENKIMSFEETK